MWVEFKTKLSNRFQPLTFDLSVFTAHQGLEIIYRQKVLSNLPTKLSQFRYILFVWIINEFLSMTIHMFT